MNKFDLIIIGGGAGAFAAAIRANELKAKTAIINAGLPIGGTCVNVGCVPSKTLLWAGEIMHTAKHHDIPGIELEIKNFDFQKVIEDERALVEHLRVEKYEKVLKNLEHVTLIDAKDLVWGRLKCARAQPQILHRFVLQNDSLKVKLKGRLRGVCPS